MQCKGNITKVAVRALPATQAGWGDALSLRGAAKLTAAATPPRWDPRAGESQVIPSQLNPAPAIAPHMVFSFWEMQAEGRQDGRDPTSLRTFPEMRSDFFPPHTLIFMPPPLNTV